jgi:uncharacterized cupin superfamily protein
MYTSSILSLPLAPDGPADPDRPDQASTTDWALSDDGDVRIGVWECAPGTFGGATGDFDEMMYMVSGRLSVTHTEGTFDIVPGTLWVTPRNFPCTWTVHQSVRKLYVIDRRTGTGAGPELLANVYTAALPPAAPRPNPFVGAPMETTLPIWDHNGMQTGVWECTPGEFPFNRAGYDEVFTVLAGHATMEMDNGLAFDLRPGSMLLTPNGTKGRWIVHETLRKVYAIIRR